MNNIFSFHKKLNIKKITIAIIIIILLIFIILFYIISTIISNQNAEKIEAQNPNYTFYDAKNSISIELPKKYGLIQYNPTNNYLIELRSDNNLGIFISNEQLLDNRSLETIASADLRSYIGNFDGYSNLSKLKEFDYAGCSAYTYCLHYLDSKTKTAFYLQTFWIESESGYYIIDIEFPLNDLNNYTNIINETLNNFIIK